MPRRGNESRMKAVSPDILVVTGLVGLVLLGGASVLGTLPAPEGDLLLVLVPPWAEGEEVVHMAGGQVLGPVSAPLSVFATGTTPERLHAAGAFWVADGRLAARLCGIE